MWSFLNNQLFDIDVLIAKYKLTVMLIDYNYF